VTFLALIPGKEMREFFLATFLILFTFLTTIRFGFIIKNIMFLGRRIQFYLSNDRRKSATSLKDKVFFKNIFLNYFFNLRIYTTMIGKRSTLKKLKFYMEKKKILKYKIFTLTQGRTFRWVLAWSFFENINLDLKENKF